jgi:DNA-binding CsgD family transcriptional regulator
MELVEREELLARLRDLHADARAGSGRQVLVGGEAGAGKTVLVRTFVAGLDGEMRVLTGSCDPLSAPRPLAPFHEMRSFADLMARDSNRHAFLTAILGELELATVMVIEDAHWADEATLDALRFVGRRIDLTRSLVLVTFRDDEISGDHPLQAVLGDLATASGVERLAVPPLTADGVAKLAAGHGFDSGHLHRVTGGNPFYVTEVLAAPSWTVPATVSDAVRARVSRLSSEARDLLELVSVSPVGLEPELAEALQPNAGAALDECAERGVLFLSGERVTFRHELARLAVEAAATPRRRRNLNGALLEVLENVGDADPARLAHHASAAGDAARTLHYAPAAAREASARGAHREAARQYARAVAYGERLSPAERADLLSVWADERSSFDDPAEVAALRADVVDLRRRVGDRSGEGVALRKLARAISSTGRFEEGERVNAEAVAVLDASDSAAELALSYAQLGYLAEIGYRAEDALSWSAKAIDLATRVDSMAASSLALSTTGEVNIMFREDLVGMTELQESRRLSLALGDDLAAANAIINLGASLIVIRRYALAATALREALEFARERDLDHFVAYAEACVAWIHLERGEWSQAEVLLEEVPESSQAFALVPVLALAVRGRLLARRGDPAARETLRHSWDAASRAGALSHLWPSISGRLEEAWLSGRRDEPATVAAVALEILGKVGIPWLRSELAFWLRRTGVIEHPPHGVTGPFALQMSGNWNEAADEWERLGCPYQQADALADGDEAALRRALDIFSDLGAVPAADHVRERMRRAGIANVPSRPRHATRASPAQLTRRQLEVLALVEAGLSNAEIARRLHITEKTAGHHVSAILRKVRAKSRGEAAARARELGIAAAAR